ncbi:YebC/PmpR family DNA-binding transcriptional regulator [Patescibacteria group bacterium]|nr:YebC/PmpR family DNA-binding transcriptional regulator [Patescibacteria group bacterium]MCG2701514.1 YebC/PmpR family DNA-binding transcriptional regulator [Candidatus Parcubacteria bacterium]MBU4265283.1 YebC/PmpR family DNA-binding transcriptional regulator [Patescibacteria group bacterium]MBU4389968.1 YebC/PmpR family DNA-binding transcriptional regulator [Patescibacteria group bacterium]MBU4396825.1 YebC/PmpR family DNA-binding transcriptional regulator [Patescibacteria group bacterium]
MSGHSKWANIRVRKGIEDKKRSAIFTRMAKVILVAVRQGGNNTDSRSNPYLRIALDRAKKVNMPKSNIVRLLENFENRKSDLKTFFLEGYGPFGVPVVVEVETDNRIRVLAEVKFIFKSNDGNLGESGSVLYLFDKIGEIEVVNLTEKKKLELIDLGVIDFYKNLVVVNYVDLSDLVEKMEKRGWEIVRYGIGMKCKSPMILEDENKLNKLLDLRQELEENEDVVNVFMGIKNE